VLSPLPVTQNINRCPSQGWARKWRSNNWKKSDCKKALNPDLWGRLLDLCDRHQVKFVWVRGHAGHPENERCDQMATTAAAGEGLPADEWYELTAISGDERLPDKPDRVCEELMVKNTG
jgi:ribonuclease HI